MKKIIIIACLLSITIPTNSQSCPIIQGVTPVSVRFATNAYGYPESNFPTIPLYWNRFYKLNELTGRLNPVTCSYTGDPNLHELAYCACILAGTYFRKVTDGCDATPCGGDVDSIPALPKTNDSSIANKWSQNASWTANQVPDILASLSVLITKPMQLDTDLNFPKDHWLIISGGNSAIPADKIITVNSVIQIYQAAQLENFGTLKGSGEIVGNLQNSGTLSPGNSPGKFTITGNYNATNTAVHQIEIASASIFDTINVLKDAEGQNGNAVLAGMLNVSLLNGFVPALGDSFKILTFSAATGSFSTLNLPALPVGLSWNVKYNPSNIMLTVNATVLPLTITYLGAYKKNGGVQVEWTTQNEINVKNYEVERKVVGADFNKSGTVTAYGRNSNSYGWFDASPVNGDNYYRVKAVDKDSKSMYSSIQLIKFSSSNKIEVYPNPAKRGEPLNIRLQHFTATKIELMTADGQVVYSKASDIRSNPQIILSPSLASGQYLIRVTGNNKTATQKIIVQ
ncbi:MAG: T9SS type A sorting domain-containing protein [Ferruginibacter sp.]